MGEEDVCEGQAGVVYSGGEESSERLRNIVVRRPAFAVVAVVGFE